HCVLLNINREFARTDAANRFAVDLGPLSRLCIDAMSDAPGFAALAFDAELARFIFDPLNLPSFLPFSLRALRRYEAQNERRIFHSRPDLQFGANAFIHLVSHLAA